ncbi:MAG TPA: hypothetical protein VKU62_14075 [Thermoanaerobaculia bacterium]|nr:hypothetical protein [Thermoanaerobaculia bacterium]
MHAIVEVGSYVGGFLHVAREWGWDAIGVDVDRDTSHFAQAHGYATRQGPREAWARPDSHRSITGQHRTSIRGFVR